MRQRITYLLPSGTGINPDDIKLDAESLRFMRQNDYVAEERRITLGLDELPDELRVFLDDFHELHLRIASLEYHEAFSPALARVPPGLHAFFTPRKAETRYGAVYGSYSSADADTSSTKLCTMLKGFLSGDIKCSNHDDSFSKPPILSERFASSSTYQFYSPLDFLNDTHKPGSRICSGAQPESPTHAVCQILSKASTANYVDLDFDAISHTVTITVMWIPLSDGPFQVIKEVRKHGSTDRLEVGILSPEEPKEPEELSLGGFLAVVGEDDHFSATLFSFPSRHHSVSAENGFTKQFQQPTGLHPKLDITLPRQALQAPKDTCALHAYWTLPSTLFIDRYQLSDPLFLQSQNLVSLRAISGEQDLEAPEWTINGWGSAALFEIALPNDTDAKGTWTATVPTHLRYLNATASPSGHAEVSVPWPVVFWACTAEEGLKMATNPFDRVNLGYDGLFGPKTMFYHVSPNPDDGVLTETLKVPVLSPESATWVPLGTMVAVLLGFGWICWQLLKGEQVPAVKAEKKSE